MLDAIVSNKSLDLKGRVRNIFIAFFVMLFWTNTVVWLLGALSGMNDVGASDFMLQFFAPPIKWQFFFACVMAPLWEELAFRVIPIQIAKKLDSHYDGGIFWYIVALSCLLFGWGHGQGTISLMIQGSMGLVFSILYIKNGYNYWSSVALHAMWNTSCLFLF